ncbi:MAG TPA: TolC family protein, partial [Pseudomonadales bacterium]|nr:TolC family protein [Pseudomonadales bacterium]
LETVRRNLTQTTRILHSQLLTDVERVKARQQAVTSSESALKATEVGYEVGTRNIVELLQSQRMLYATQREYARSRYDYVVRYLQLKQATAQLAPTDLLDLNAWLQAPGSVKP